MYLKLLYCTSANKRVDVTVVNLNVVIGYIIGIRT